MRSRAVRLCAAVAVVSLAISVVPSSAFSSSTTTTFSRPHRPLFASEDDATTKAAAVVAPPKVGGDQAKYGDELPLPPTYAKCGRCQAAFAITAEDLGSSGKGCRVECNVCPHSWFQTRDKLFTVGEGYELKPFSRFDIGRIKSNVEAGRRPSFTGDAKLYVGNLDFGCTENDLFELFQDKAGEVGEVNIVRDNETGRSRGFAFVAMMTKEGGEKGLELNGEELMGRDLLVKEPNN